MLFFNQKAVLLAIATNCIPVICIAAHKWDGVTSKECIPKARHITSMVADGRGGVWIGSENIGIFHYQRNENEGVKVKQFTRKSTGGYIERHGPTLTNGTANTNALGDNNIYALAFDKVGRLWTGHLNHGVSVFNGKAWRNYDVLSGPLGERIFDIETNPIDGSVWMASNVGLARYIPATSTWEYYNRSDGLPEDQVTSLAFGKKGTIYAGTQCHGIAINIPRKMSDGTLKYSNWQKVTAPDRFGPKGQWRTPLSPRGIGLPTNMINDLLVARNGTVWAATTTGLAWSKDKGRNWRYLRGRNYAAKVEMSYAGKPAGWKGISTSAYSKLLPEDYITCLAETDTGELLLGTWNSGFIAMDEKGVFLYHGTVKSIKLGNNYVTTIVPLANNTILVGTYGGGIVEIQLTGEKKRKAIEQTKRYAELPVSAKAPTIAELERIDKKIQISKSITNKAAAAYIGEDWMTWGDWIGRYGKHLSINCAANAPYDRSTSDADVYVGGFIGPNHKKRDALRRWCPKPGRSKFNHHKALWVLQDGIRTQSSWDDHGEAYPREHQGPGIWLEVSVPEGVYQTTLYFFNCDGQWGPNRFRDYLITIFSHPGISKKNHNINYRNMYREEWSAEYNKRRMIAMTNIIAAHKSKELCKTRVRNFYGGVYKSFLLKGRNEYLINIRKNSSFNVKFSGVFMTRMSGKVPRHEKGSVLPGIMHRVVYKNDAYKRLCDKYTIFESSQTQKAIELWNCNNAVALKKRTYELLKPTRILAYRTALANGASKELLYDWRWDRYLWTNGDRKEFQDAMKFQWYRYQKRCVGVRLKKEAKASPNVFDTSKEWEKHEQEFLPVNKFRRLD